MLALLLAFALGGQMTIGAAYVDVWFGKPPLQRLDFDLTVKNPSNAPRWLFVPDTLGTSSQGGVYGVTVYEVPGPLWNIAGAAGGWAVKLAPKGEITLRRLGISAWYSELPPYVTLACVLAEDITIGGQSIARFVGLDRTTSGANDGRIDRMKAKVAAFKQTDKEANGVHKDVALGFVGKQEQPVRVWLVGAMVTLQGKAEEAKEGPVLVTADGQVWVEADGRWPRGQRVRVMGKVGVKNDRPVFAQKPGEPIRAGVPVPEGTDLDAASRRYVIGGAKWTVLSE